MDDPKLSYGVFLVFVAFIAAVYLWLKIAERRALSNWRQYAKDRGYPDAKIRGDLPPVEWENVREKELEDGLDLAKLYVIDEPSREQP